MKTILLAGLTLGLAGFAAMSCTTRTTTLHRETETTRPAAPRVEERTTVETVPPPADESTTVIKKRHTETVE